MAYPIKHEYKDDTCGFRNKTANSNETVETGRYDWDERTQVRVLQATIFILIF